MFLSTKVGLNIIILKFKFQINSSLHVDSERRSKRRGGQDVAQYYGVVGHGQREVMSCSVL